METIASNACFGGTQLRLRHAADTTGCDMTVSVYLPPAASGGGSATLPVLYWLSGLTCTDENFVQKAGAQRVAAQLGMVIVAPDTSPRGEGVPDAEDGAYDFGLGAGFYLDATQEPWRKHYQMYSYITAELPQLIKNNFAIDPQRAGIAGHSMGGHGALTIALKNPGTYRSVSAFAPIVAPTRCPWGRKALSGYLGDDEESWGHYDAVQLMEGSPPSLPMLIDQGGDDDFLKEQLQPELLLDACRRQDYPLTYKLRDGYDHSYFFIATFIEDHLRFHYDNL